MDKKLKRKLIILASLVVYYLVFSYIPWERNIGQRGFLIARLIAFAPALGLLIFFKHYWHFEIDRPHLELRYSFLLPLLVFINLNFLAALIFGYSWSKEASDVPLLILELFSDCAAAVFEDLLFVDLFICVLLDCMHFKHAKLLSIFLSATLFTLAHAYTFLYPGDFSNPMAVALLQEIFVFLLTLVCGYLAIYFDSALIPVAFHFLYNAVNHILFYHYCAFEISWPYVLFVSTVALLGIFYFTSLWQMSEHQAFRKNKKPEGSLEKKDGGDYSAV